MRWDIKVNGFWCVAAACFSVCLMVAPEYLGIVGILRPLVFWGGLIGAVVFGLAGARVGLRGEVNAPLQGHRRRMVGLYGMIVCGIGFLGFAAVYWWPAPARDSPVQLLPSVDLILPIPQKTAYKSYYSQKQKDEIADGLRDAISISQDVGKKLRDGVYKLEEYRNAMRMGTENSEDWRLSKDNIEQLWIALRDYQSFVNSLSIKGISKDSQFLHDSYFKDESTYLMKEDDFVFAVNTIINATSEFYSRIDEVKIAFSGAPNSMVAERLMGATRAFIIRLIGATGDGFSKWSFGVKTRADEMERAILRPSITPPGAPPPAPAQ